MAPAAAQPADTSWHTPLLADLRQVAALEAEAHRLELGVHVRDLASGATANWGGKRDWYLASMVKVPVAIALLQGVDKGLFTLDTLLTVRADDYVDGAGRTNFASVGTPLSVRFLLAQMVIQSDNTASDMLIGLVGLEAVNALVHRQVPQGLGRITRLAEVRRQVYGRLTPEAAHLSGPALLRIHREQGDAARMRRVAQITGVPPARWRLHSLDEAWRDYYASGLNGGRLDAYGELLAQLAQGTLLSASGTAHLLDLMARVVTGPRRRKAGLPPYVRLAHKTGTQRERTHLRRRRGARAARRRGARAAGDRRRLRVRPGAPRPGRTRHHASRRCHVPRRPSCPRSHFPCPCLPCPACRPCTCPACRTPHACHAPGCWRCCWP